MTIVSSYLLWHDIVIRIIIIVIKIFIVCEILLISLRFVFFEHSATYRIITVTYTGIWYNTSFEDDAEVTIK